MTSPISDIATSALRMALNGLDRRQQAISNNIANLETPGYLAQEVSFEDNLRQAVADGAPLSAHVDVSSSLAATRINGNNVNIDTEMMASSENQLRQKLAIQALNSEYAVMRTAITGR